MNIFRSRSIRPNLFLIAGGFIFQHLAAAQVYADACPAADGSNCIYYQSFDQATGPISGDTFTANTGWKIDSNNSATVKYTPNGKHGSAVIIDNASAPTGINIAASTVFNGSHLPAQGTISFWFKPSQSSDATDTDWINDGFVTRSRKFFNIKDLSTGASILGMQKYRDSTVSFLAVGSSVKDYVSTNPYDQTKLGPSANWTTHDNFHLIEITWDISNRYFALIIDGNYIQEYDDLSDSDIAAFTATFSSQTIFTFGNDGGNAWGGNGSWTLNGAIDEFKVYNIARYGYRNPDQYKLNAVNNGVREPWETPENSSADAMLKQANPTNAQGAPQYFFTTPAYQVVTESTLPDASDSNQKIFSPADVNQVLIVNMLPGETQSIYVNYYNYGDQINSASASVTDFSLSSDASKTIANPELYLVSNWFQSGDNLNTGALPRYVPELLLTRETPKLNGYSNSTASDNVTEVLPNLPAASKSVPAVKLPKNSTRRFMLRLTVPVSAPPGQYSGTITVNSGSAVSLPIQVKVGSQPLTMLDKDALIFHQEYSDEYIDPTGLSFKCGGTKVSQSVYESELSDLKNHGMNGEHSYGYGSVNANLIQQHGLDKTIALNNPSCLPPGYAQQVKQMVQNEIGFIGKIPYFFTQDEIHLHREKICWHIGAAPIFRPPALITTTTSVALTNSLKTNTTYTDGSGCTGMAPIDLMNIEADSGGLDALPFLARRALGDPSAAVLPAPKNTYYWQLFSEDGRLNRFNAGYFLWMTGMDGIYPYGYMPNNTPTAFNDFDERKDQVVYPSANGPIPTVQWEALREGLNDYRYLLTWKRLLLTADSTNQQQADLAAASQSKMNDILARYKDSVITPLKNNCVWPFNPPTDTVDKCKNKDDQSVFLRNVSPAQFESDRRTMWNEIQALAASQQVSLTLESIAAEDGRLTESAFKSGTAASWVDSAGTGLPIGLAQGLQLKSFVSFDMSALPSNAYIDNIQLLLYPKSPSKYGYPLTFGTPTIEIPNCIFGNSSALQTADFVGSSSISAPLTTSGTNAHISVLPAADIWSLHCNSKLQLRFDLALNSTYQNSTAATFANRNDYFEYFSGNGSVGQRPILKITYHLQ